MTVVISTVTGRRYEVEDDAYKTYQYKEYDPCFDETDYHWVKVWNVIAEESDMDIIDMVKKYAEENKADEDNTVYDFEQVAQ